MMLLTEKDYPRQQQATILAPSLIARWAFSGLPSWAA